MAKSVAAKCRDDPTKTLEATYERHVNMLHRVCYSYIKNSTETEDVVADVFIKLLEKCPKFDNDEHEKAWLLRTAINLCKDRIKHWWRKRANIDDYQHLESSHEFMDDNILKAVMALPDRYKAVVYLYYYEGYPSPEIAKILKKPQSTILNHLSEARKILKGVLANEQ